jgi:hypothetical protein
VTYRTLIIANRRDEFAADCAAALQARSVQVSVVEPGFLSTYLASWCWDTEQDPLGALRMDGETPVSSVLLRVAGDALAAIPPRGYLDPEDAYGAAEWDASIRSMLALTKQPVLNRPSWCGELPGEFSSASLAPIAKALGLRLQRSVGMIQAPAPSYGDVPEPDFPSKPAGGFVGSRSTAGLGGVSHGATGRLVERFHAHAVLAHVVGSRVFMERSRSRWTLSTPLWQRTRERHIAFENPSLAKDALEVTSVLRLQLASVLFADDGESQPALCRVRTVPGFARSDPVVKQAVVDHSIELLCPGVWS